jgi:hypothetical protein
MGNLRKKKTTTVKKIYTTGKQIFFFFIFINRNAKINQMKVEQNFGMTNL